MDFSHLNNWSVDSAAVALSVVSIVFLRSQRCWSHCLLRTAKGEYIIFPPFRTVGHVALSPSVIHLFS